MRLLPQNETLPATFDIGVVEPGESNFAGGVLDGTLSEKFSGFCKKGANLTDGADKGLGFAYH
ncbi:MAG: hypothetical protein UV32_C0001G0035 [Candidatus Collierbacteria bacterium GW2011_GWF2_42_51]|nr:MAG: hypothetical protein UV32_C0001G0035 [Candidatus Collierbacteria bacterium GW2011_GWF2_42_51]